MTIQQLEEEKEIVISNVDEFQATLYTKHPVKPKKQANKTSNNHAVTKKDSVLRTRDIINHFTVKEAKEGPVEIVRMTQVVPPRHLPIIKLQYLANQPRLKLKPKEVKLLTPKKLTNRDVLNAMAHPKLFPTSPELEMAPGEGRIVTGLNDWVLANSLRERNKFLVYSAYWDDRFSNENYVRVMAIMVTRNPPPVFCRIQMSDGKTIDARANRKVMNEHWKLRYSSVFINCEVPKNTDPPLKVLVSLNRNFTYSAMVPVHRNKENIVSPRGEIAVCVKPFHFSYDRATWLLEFIELHRVLGAEHFFFYNHTIGPNVDALLRNYMSQKVVTVLPWNLPVLSQKEIRTEAIFTSLNECVFRTMYLYKYVVLLDFDEYIIPREHDNYLDMIHQLEEDHKNIRGQAGSFVFKNVFFYLYWENDTTSFGVEPEKAPQYVPYLLTQYKTRRLSTAMKVGSRSKFIVVPERIVEVGNHVVWRHTSGSRAINAPDTIGLLHHYRICEFGGFSCLKKESVTDRTAQKFGSELLKRVMRRCRLIFPNMNGTCPISPPLGSPW
ncbi:hypothetical protein JTE90_022799 [Oedothorax gibbosus]|uniref:Glycosyltransferase family 92 protein n=1 Tax=Oedothorax gibbosus TaxID=931172 RepID=A0AAV6V843_9ARAC|nr:hypothetical protein JTE90_022799 [Oedothorax gibbosus]